MTEPIEFAVMFVAWPLYVVHAVLTGTSMALANALDVRSGFGFSAGLFDFIHPPALLRPAGIRHC